MRGRKEFFGKARELVINDELLTRKAFRCRYNPAHNMQGNLRTYFGILKVIYAFELWLISCTNLRRESTSLNALGDFPTLLFLQQMAPLGKHFRLSLLKAPSIKIMTYDLPVIFCSPIRKS